MPQDKPDWMQEEEGRATQQATTGKTTNATAPQLVRVDKAPERKQKAFYIQPSYAEAFEDLALKQKRSGGKKATELAEEMIFDLLKKYGEDTTKL
jgi:hypothetical protein